MGSSGKVFFWRKVCGNSAGKFAEICNKYVLLHQEMGAESLRKFSGHLRKLFCNDPFPNNLISELLKLDRDSLRSAMEGGVFHTVMRGAMFVRNGAVTPGPSMRARHHLFC